MRSTYVQRVGVTTTPFAIVIWKMPDMQLACKTICYDENEVQNTLSRQHQGFFKQLVPTVHYVEVAVSDISEKVS